MESDGRTGQIMVLDRAGAGDARGHAPARLRRQPQPVDADSVRHAEITPRDIDRAGFPHFLLKEISESPLSFQKTLRGKIVRRRPSRGSARTPCRRRCWTACAGGTIKRIVVDRPGHRRRGRPERRHRHRHAWRATFPSSRCWRRSCRASASPTTCRDTLIVAVSQSGTTTDTNRTVDLVRARGADVVAIVNRRNSDLVDKADGVLYTSDGRDVEMSVASTKAFYAQVAAGWILAARARRAPRRRDASDKATACCAGCGRCPAAMAGRPRAARRRSPPPPAPRPRRAATGPSSATGPNRVAAEEVRIKLSELCYHAIACDGTEDKKHIDLSSEPMILVCAAGLERPQRRRRRQGGRDLRAPTRPRRSSSPPRGRARASSAALHTIEVPVVEPEFGFVLSAMVGHLFGYEAALAIDALALPLREARVAVEHAVESGRGDPGLAHRRCASPPPRFFAGLRDGRYNGNLEASTAVGVAALLRYASGAAARRGLRAGLRQGRHAGGDHRGPRGGALAGRVAS